jgi:FixJ family two-component response regulator
VEPSSTGVIFRLQNLPPATVVLLLRGVVQGKSASQMARELDLSRTTVHEIRQQLQANAQANATLLQPETPLPDEQTETDEMFQNAGKKR